MKTLLFGLILAISAQAHPGALDSHGGHWDSKINAYHYHTHNVATWARKLVEATPYKRKDWCCWTDPDKNGWNTRQDVLRRDSKTPTALESKGDGSEHLRGMWICPYTGKIAVQEEDVDADHLVPLEHVHGLGGWAWTPAQKHAFFNDPVNLIAVDAPTNSAKGSKSIVFWRPPLKAFWPEYALRWKIVKAKYRLPISAAEKKVMDEMLGTKP